jgi:hypothetical protein
MNQMQEALYRVGAHIVFKEVRTITEPVVPLRRIKVPLPIWRKRKTVNFANQRVIGGIALDPVNRQAAIATSRAPTACYPL